MNSLKYREYTDSINIFCSATLQILEKRQEPEIKELTEKFRSFLQVSKKEPKLSIAFVGQYNAGKSTTIAALTNAEFHHKQYKEVEGEKKLVEVYKVGNEDLYVGAQIMTDQTKEYMWNDVRIIDTPGIYAGRTDHDQKTIQQISKSDLLIFVVSNELFNPQGGEFFREIVQGMQRVGQVMLVINKMSREYGKPETLQKSLLEVIEPNHPRDFYTCYIDAYDYLNSLLEDDLEEKKYLLEDSNFDSFLQSLQKLIDKNKITAKLLTPLHMSSEVLEQAYNHLVSEDKLQRDMLEIFRRKGLIIRSAMNRFKNGYISELNKFEHQVVILGENVVGKVDGNHSSEEINSALKGTERDIEIASEQTLKNVQALLTEQVEQLKDDLEDLQNSALGRNISDMLEANQNKKSFKEKEFSKNNAGSSLLEKGPEALSKVGSFAANVSKEAVYNFVKFFGGKFKPWGAVNLTKFINKLGPVLSIIGTILDIFISAKEEYDEAAEEQKLREARADIRKDFRTIANEIRNEYENNIKSSINPLFLDEISAVEKDQEELRNVESSKEDSAKEVSELLIKVKKTISEISDL